MPETQVAGLKVTRKEEVARPKFNMVAHGYLAGSKKAARVAIGPEAQDAYRKALAAAILDPKVTKIRVRDDDAPATRDGNKRFGNGLAGITIYGTVSL